MKNKILLVLLALISFLCISGCSFDTSSNTEYNIEVVDNENCDITVSKETAKKNEEITVTVENITKGYELDKITANGFRIVESKFLMPAQDVKIEVFLKNEETSKIYNINYVSNENCTISLSKSKAQLGDMVEVEVSNITSGYEVRNIKINGVLINGYTFEMPSCDVEVEVSLSEITYAPTDEFTVSLVQNDKCTITVSKETAFKDDEVTVTVSDILVGYRLLKVKVNGFTIEGNTFKMPSCNISVEAVIVPDMEYSVEVMDNEYAQITLEKEKYSIGETVSIDYLCKGYYVLDKFYVNGEEIVGNLFEMPNRDVTVSATFKNVIENPACNFIVTSAGNDGRYYSYFTYGENGLYVKVIADDRYVYGTEISDNPAYQDNIEIILSPKSSTAGYDTNKTYKFLISCTGDGYVQVASSINAWRNISLGSEQYKSSAVIKSYDNKDGYDGYEINFFVSYDVFGLTKDTALGNITVCVATRNVNTYQKSEWDPGTWASYAKGGCKFGNISTHPVINSDGTIGERS